MGETKQTLGKRLYQHRRASTSGCRDSAVYTHLNSASHSFDNKDVIILDRESRWFERGVKEALYVKREQPSLNKGGGLRHNLSGPTVQQNRMVVNITSSTLQKFFSASVKTLPHDESRFQQTRESRFMVNLR